MEGYACGSIPCARLAGCICSIKNRTEEAYDYLNQGGNLTIVIQKKQGAPSAKAKMEDVFGNAEVVKKDKGYYILRSEKI